MTTDEALTRWTECRQVSHRKGIYTPEENWGSLARKLRSYVSAEEISPGILRLTTANGAQHFVEVR